MGWCISRGKKGIQKQIVEADKGQFNDLMTSRKC